MATGADSTRRGISMDINGRKRKAHWDTEAEIDPLSLSTPATKRAFCSPTPETTATTPDTQTQLPCPQPSPCIFHPPTGNLHDRFFLSDTSLGSGQFGSVRECTDVLTGERLACKTVKKVVGARSQAQAEELKNEFGLMLALSGHNGIVQPRGVFEDADSVHLVMDLCDGGDLFAETVRRGRFTESDAAVLFAEIVSAVSFCHNRGVMHRDLKPENILLNHQLDATVSAADVAVRHGLLIKVADMGLSAAVHQGREIRGVAGSPFYMAPEVIAGCAYDFKADVWSLGVILYILLSGNPPFWGATDADVFAAISGNKPNMGCYPFNEVSSEAKSLIKCLLNKSPEKRPPAQKILSHPWLLHHHVARRSRGRKSVGLVAKPAAVSVV